MIPAALFSISPVIASTTLWPFYLFMAGHIIWSYFGFKYRDWALVALNLGFIPIDIWGLIVRL